ncbi:MAG: 2-C-methyl-D-erythritol 2,4-cyclodiphosphate synthase [Nitrospirota bacterium]
MRIGIGYDIHRLAQGLPCRLGGVTIPHEKGMVGYSDGDPLLHAICDALLGAAGLGDIGIYFPSGDPKWKGINSLTLLSEVAMMLTSRNYRIVNIDSVIIAEQPKIAPHVGAMRASISQCLKIESACVNIKATTNEGIGFIGREEGIAAQAVCIIEHH